jgi:hypothetical protein
MQPIEVDPRDSRLRVVFVDAVVSFSLAAYAIFEDIARRMSELSNRRYGDPIAIDVTLAGPPVIRSIFRVPSDKRYFTRLNRHSS